jgi:hypothetical protein
VIGGVTARPRGAGQGPARTSRPNGDALGEIAAPDRHVRVREYRTGNDRERGSQGGRLPASQSRHSSTVGPQGGTVGIEAIPHTLRRGERSLEGCRYGWALGDRASSRASRGVDAPVAGGREGGALERVGASYLSSDAKALSLPASNQGDGDGVILFAAKHVHPHHNDPA